MVDYQQIHTVLLTMPNKVMERKIRKNVEERDNEGLSAGNFSELKTHEAPHRLKAM